MRFFSHAKITSYKLISLSSVTFFYGALSAARSRTHEPSSFPASDADGAVADYCVPHDARSGIPRCHCLTRCPSPQAFSFALSKIQCSACSSSIRLLERGMLIDHRRDGVALRILWCPTRQPPLDSVSNRLW